MIVKDYIKDFEELGFGLFVHFGLYSIIGKGEWAKPLLNIKTKEYEELIHKFNPSKRWADNLALSARRAGCKYITLTTRHHDGFSLFDTLGLNDYDAPHSAAERDLVREFVDACRKHSLVPFFYHTLLDWRHMDYKTNFLAYLKYLRDSVEILCTRYGTIGGIWFDGMWNKPHSDWEEDALYGMIRSHQPNAMIINNTGLVALGETGHIEIDSVTFERGKPSRINLQNSPKYVAGEMCQVFGDHWGYAAQDINFKSVREIVENLCECRQYNFNFLLNVGLKATGSLRDIEAALLKQVGIWTRINSQALYTAKKTDIPVSGDKNFVLRGKGCYYLFVHDVIMSADPNVAAHGAAPDMVTFDLPESVKSVHWLDDGTPAEYEFKEGSMSVKSKVFEYGRSLMVRVAKILTE